ncbi:MAG TPA: hypothetical protein P5121_01215 [Caldilineaceae bacterium]|nr:hypothetical protein [Caldilineaceae bacterium]
MTLHQSMHHVTDRSTQPNAVLPAATPPLEDSALGWEFWHYLQIIRKWFWLFLLGGLLAGTVAYIISSYVMIPRYLATTTLMVKTSGMTAANAADSRFNDYDSFLANEYMAATYQQLAMTGPVIEEVAQRFGWQRSQLTENVDISLIPKTPLLEISYEGEDPKEATQIANDMAVVVIESAATAEWIPGRELVVMEEAREPTTPVSPRTILNTLVAAIVGMAVVVALVFVREYLRFVNQP